MDRQDILCNSKGETGVYTHREYCTLTCQTIVKDLYYRFLIRNTFILSTMDTRRVS